MSLPLVVQAGVRNEIDDAYAWYESQRPGSGEEFLIEVKRVLDPIERNPEIHAPVYQAVRHGRVKRFMVSEGVSRSRDRGGRAAPGGGCNRPA